MRVYEIAKQIGMPVKNVLDMLSENGITDKGQMSSISDEEHDLLKEKFADEIKRAEEENARIEAEEKARIEAENAKAKALAEQKALAKEAKKNMRKFLPDDPIPCRCVRPNKVNALGARTQSLYTWDGYGEVIDVAFADLQAWKAAKKKYITEPKFIIEDEELYEQWKKDLDPIYENYLGLDYPEQFFDVNDTVFRENLKKYPKALQDLIKIQAMKMIKEGSFNSLTKLSIIDEILGTDLKEFV